MKTSCTIVTMTQEDSGTRSKVMFYLTQLTRRKPAHVTKHTRQLFCFVLTWIGDTT